MATVALVLLLAINYATSLNTNPPAENFGSADVTAPENASNVTIFCEVTFGNGNTDPRTSVWSLTTKTEPKRGIIFNSESNYNTDRALQSNFIIVKFGADLDMATLECTNGLPNSFTQTVFFTLRTLG